jgi:hypothetical protein
MGEKLYHSGSPSGFQYENSKIKVGNNLHDTGGRRKEDKDLVIEENTVYEIDRECYERLKRQRKRKI